MVCLTLEGWEMAVGAEGGAGASWCQPRAAPLAQLGGAVPCRLTLSLALTLGFLLVSSPPQSSFVVSKASSCPVT